MAVCRHGRSRRPDDYGRETITIPITPNNAVSIASFAPYSKHGLDAWVMFDMSGQIGTAVHTDLHDITSAGKTVVKHGGVGSLSVW